MQERARKNRQSVAYIVGLCLVAAPSLVRAQTNGTLAGKVTDATGAAVPGVHVTAVSPALIEGVRAVVTDQRGQYQVIDLRPGTYTLTFARPGFQTTELIGIALESTFTATVNARLEIGDVEERVQVSARSPAVDVHRDQRQFTLGRDLFDAVPTTRNIQSIGALIPGVKLNVPDVGGVNSITQTFMSVHGTDSRHVTVQIDGMVVNGLQFDGAEQSYHNDAVHQELTFQTSGISVETSAGGLLLNIVPRQGGNQLSGSLYVGGSSGSWQADNLDEQLRDRGLSAANRVKRLSDVNPALGGPVVRDRLWFFASYRQLRVDDYVAGSVFDDGRQAVNDQWIQNGTVRLTWQMSPRNKLTGYMDRTFKYQSHLFQNQATESASRRRTPILYYVGQAKWTSTPNNRLLVDVGYSSTVLNYRESYQAGVAQTRDTPLWFASASRLFEDTQELTTAAESERGVFPERFVVSTSASYVTGSHALKGGLQWAFGTNRETRTANADLLQQYLSGESYSVGVYNTPVIAVAQLNYDLGLYLQDSWTIDRVTVNSGVRFEWFDAELPAQAAPAGRFVPARQFARVAHLPTFFDVSPRFGIAYDLFGDGRTALKASVGQYLQPWTTGFAQRYNPMFFSVDMRTWADLNGDDIAQDDEIGPQRSVNWGIAQTRFPDPNLRRVRHLAYNLSAQHELFPRVAVTAAYYRRSFRHLDKFINVLQDQDAYIPVTLDDPRGNGERVDLLVLPFDQFGAGEGFDTDAEGDSRVYEGIELSFNARLPGGGAFFGGWTTERTVEVSCERKETSRHLRDYRYCDERQFTIPFRGEFKLSGFYPLAFGLQASLAWQSYAGQPLGLDWVPRSSDFAAEGLTRQGSAQANLLLPGTAFADRSNQLDLGLAKVWTIGGARLTARANIYNVANANTVLRQVETFGSRLGKPLRILQPRILRLETTVTF